MFARDVHDDALIQRFDSKTHRASGADDEEIKSFNPAIRSD
jgi:hypothetical protein